MRPRLLLTINCKFAVDFFARGLHTRTAVARLHLRQLGFLVFTISVNFGENFAVYLRSPISVKVVITRYVPQTYFVHVVRFMCLYSLSLLFYTKYNKKAQLSLTNPRDACEKFARFT